MAATDEPFETADGNVVGGGEAPAEPEKTSPVAATAMLTPATRQTGLRRCAIRPPVTEATLLTVATECGQEKGAKGISACPLLRHSARWRGSYVRRHARRVAPSGRRSRRASVVEEY